MQDNFCNCHEWNYNILQVISTKYDTAHIGKTRFLKRKKKYNQFRESFIKIKFYEKKKKLKRNFENLNFAYGKRTNYSIQLFIFHLPPKISLLNLPKCHRQLKFSRTRSLMVSISQSFAYSPNFETQLQSQLEEKYENCAFRLFHLRSISFIIQVYLHIWSAVTQQFALLVLLLVQLSKLFKILLILVNY